MAFYFVCFPNLNVTKPSRAHYSRTSRRTLKRPRPAGRRSRATARSWSPPLRASASSWRTPSPARCSRTTTRCLAHQPRVVPLRQVLSAKDGVQRRQRVRVDPSRRHGGRLVRLPDSPHAPRGLLVRSVRTWGARRTRSRGTRIRPLQDSLGAPLGPTTRPLHLIPVVDA